MWAIGLLREINIQQDKLTPIKCDNQTSLKMANNEETFKRTKHMAIKAHFVMDEIRNVTIETVFVSSKEQKSDFLTKSLTKENFTTNRNKLKRLSRKTAVVCLYLMLLSSQVLLTSGMFMPLPPIV
jgi:predicted nucleotidyltransferase